jgi:hypothetical protein
MASCPFLCRVRAASKLVFSVHDSRPRLLLDCDMSPMSERAIAGVLGPLDHCKPCLYAMMLVLCHAHALPAPVGDRQLAEATGHTPRNCCAMACAYAIHNNICDMVIMIARLSLGPWYQTSSFDIEALSFKSPLRQSCGRKVATAGHARLFGSPATSTTRMDVTPCRKLECGAAGVPRRPWRRACAELW